MENIIHFGRKAFCVSVLALGVSLTSTTLWAAADKDAKTKAGPAVAKEQHSIGGCKVWNLQVTTNSGAEVTLTMDYDYDGRGRPPIRLVTTLEKQKGKISEDTFRAEDTEVPIGQGSVSIKVRYLKEEPLTTDRIKIQLLYPISKYLLGTATFDRTINWDKGTALPPTTVAATTLAEPAPTTGSAQAAVQIQAGKPEVVPAADLPVATTNAGSFSVQSNVKRAGWQQRLTLGAGDVLHFSLFGEPDLLVEDVFVGPDGRISFLEAQNVMAAGLTIDELRQKFDEELGKFRRSPRVIITPALYQSKKYFILGRVSQKGAFTMDRPVTVIEAIARARGFETGMSDRNLVDLADLSHSFIARQGQRVPVDFEKLFLEGDLSQNIALEPNDYLYFPASDVREVYVLGEVKFPGSVSFSTGTSSTVGAIAQRGGFTEKAWRGKVLVVRGSLNRPETFVVDVKDVLAAKTPDFKLQPKDIVYISSRPWAKAEELLDVLATSFVQAAVITWTGGNIGSIIK